MAVVARRAVMKLRVKTGMGGNGLGMTIDRGHATIYG
jgi:hypothetical protein